MLTAHGSGLFHDIPWFSRQRER